MTKAFAFACFLCLAACTTTGLAPGECPNSLPAPQPGKLLHGFECTQNSDCAYGACTKSAMQLAGTAAFGVCTKDCSCGPHSTCGDDDDATKGLAFDCIRQGAAAECALECTTVADCQKASAKFTACTDEVTGYFSSGRKVCTMSK